MFGQLNKKRIVIIGSLFSIVTFAAQFGGSNFYRDQDFSEESILGYELEESAPRVIASSRPKIKVLKITDPSHVNGTWEIMRILDENSEVHFDKYNNEEDQLSEIIVDFQHTMINEEDYVRIDGDEDQLYQVFFLSETTIALVKEFNGGYERIEARRVIKRNLEEEKLAVQSDSQNNKDNNKIKGVPNLNDGEYYIINALDTLRSRDIVGSDKLEGKVVIQNGEIYIQEIVLHLGSKKETQALSLEGEIKDGGVFSGLNLDNKIVSGIITANGKDGFRIRFGTGPLQNAIINIVTEEAYEVFLEKKEIAKENEERSEKLKKEKEMDVEVRDERDQSRAKPENHELGYQF